MFSEGSRNEAKATFLRQSSHSEQINAFLVYTHLHVQVIGQTTARLGTERTWKSERHRLLYFTLLDALGTSYFKSSLRCAKGVFDALRRSYGQLLFSAARTHKHKLTISFPLQNLK